MTKVLRRETPKSFKLSVTMKMQGRNQEPTRTLAASKTKEQSVCPPRAVRRNEIIYQHLWVAQEAPLKISDLNNFVIRNRWCFSFTFLVWGPYLGAVWKANTLLTVLRLSLTGNVKDT